MHTVSDIIRDIDRGCMVHNMIEDRFSYRIVFFVNENGLGRKCYVDTLYKDLQRSLENIIRGNLTVTNNIIVTAVTARENGEIVSLLSKSYPFSLNEYFRQVMGKRNDGSNGTKRAYGKCAVE